MFFCLFLIACNEKQEKKEISCLTTDNKINLDDEDSDDINQEQTMITDEKKQEIEENIDERVKIVDNIDSLSLISNELTQLDEIENNLPECDLTEETDSNEVEIDKELEFQLKSLLCEKSNEKRSDGMKKLTIEKFVLIMIVLACIVAFFTRDLTITFKKDLFSNF